jgi:hypothetical protein
MPFLNPVYLERRGIRLADPLKFFRCPLAIQFSPLAGFVNFSDPQEEQNRDHQHGHGD